MKKRGQITIFIIIGIVIVALIGGVAVYLNQGKINTKISPEENPESVLRDCIYEEIENTLKILSYSGGSLKPKLYREFTFSDEGVAHNISFLCYTSNYYDSCVSQEPVLGNHIKSELKKSIKENMSKCFENLVTSLEDENYEVNDDYNGFNISLFTQRIEINLNAKLNYKKGENSVTKDNLKIVIPTRFYELIKLAQEISNQEAKYCNFESLGHMILYPNIDIEVLRIGDIRIYTLNHKVSNEMFRFAIRSCAMPKGVM